MAHVKQVRFQNTTLYSFHKIEIQINKLLIYPHRTRILCYASKLLLCYEHSIGYRLGELDKKEIIVLYFKDFIDAFAN